MIILFSILEMYPLMLSAVLSYKGVTIDSKLKFDQHVAKLCQKANNNISASSRVSSYLNKKQSLFAVSLFHNVPVRLLSVDMDVLLCYESDRERRRKI